MIHPQLETGGRPPIVHRHADHAFAGIKQFRNEFRRQDQKLFLAKGARYLACVLAGHPLCIDEWNGEFG